MSGEGGVPDVPPDPSGGTPDLECRRAEFSLPPELHYLNCAYMSPLPRVVEAAGEEGIRRKRNPAAIGPDDFFRQSDEVRALFARLVGAGDPTSVAILPSVSYGIGVAATNCGLEAGQNVVLAQGQFPGNVYPWQRLARDVGAELRIVEPPESGPRGARWNERILEAIDGSTGVVTLGPVHWTDGTRFDLAAVGERARDVGALFAVDGTQSVGAVPFDVGELRPDALVSAAYKWLMGPYSVALGYFAPRLHGGRPLEETWIGREGSEDFQGLVDYRDGYQPGAIRYDVGERSNFALLPMVEAGLGLILDWSPEAISAYCRALTDALVEEAGEMGFGAEERAWRSPHIVGLRMPAGLDLGEVRDALERRRVVASLRGSALRVSPHVYNDRSDVEALLEGLGSVVGGG